MPFSEIVNGEDGASVRAKLNLLKDVEEAADVTTAAKVASAGAVMSTSTDVSAAGFVVDEDDMTSDDATKVPTQQSVKKYVDDSDAVTVDTAAALFSLSVPNGTTRTSKEYSAGNGGAAKYKYDASSTATIDGGFVLPGAGGSLSFNASDVFDGTAGTGRWIRTDQSKAVVTEFGTDGVDDSGAFRRAIAAAKTVMVPKGSFVCSRDLVLEDDQTICGEGWDSHIRWSNYTAGIRATSRSNIEIRCLQLEGNNTEQSTDTFKGRGVNASACTNVRIVDCWFKKWSRASVYLEACSKAIVSRNVSQEVVYSSANPDVQGDILTNNDTEECIITNNIMLSNTKVVLSYGGQLALPGRSGVIANNIIEQQDPVGTPAASPRGHGMLVSYTDEVGQTVISNNIIRNCGNAGIYAGQAGHMVINGNQVIDCGSAATIDLVGGITFVGKGPGVITGNVVKNWQGTANGGIYALAASSTDGKVVISNNVVNEATFAGIQLAGQIQDWVVSSNYVYTSSDAGILYTSGGLAASLVQTARAVIDGNVVVTNGSATGIDINVTPADFVDAIVVRNNRIRGNDKTALGTTTDSVDRNAGILVRRGVAAGWFDGGVRIVGNEVEGYLGGITIGCWLRNRHDDGS